MITGFIAYVSNTHFDKNTRFIVSWLGYKTQSRPSPSIRLKYRHTPCIMQLPDQLLGYENQLNLLLGLFSILKSWHVL